MSPHPQASPSPRATACRLRGSSGLLRRTRPPLPSCHLNCGSEGRLWSVLRCVLIVRHSTNGLLVCGQKRKVIYLLSSPVFWQQLKGSCLRGQRRPGRRNRGADTPAPQITCGTRRHTLTHRRRRRGLTHTPRTHTISPSIGHPPPLSSPPGVPSSRALGKAAALSQQMARGRSW